jgi:uncharacterized protein YbaA (DUF1428 family)
MKDKRFTTIHPDTLPFDGNRMIYGGFQGAGRRLVRR